MFGCLTRSAALVYRWLTVDAHPAPPFTYTNPVKESHSCQRPAPYPYDTIRILRVLPVLMYTEYIPVDLMYTEYIPVDLNVPHIT